MSTILVYGGTFDPIHNGHINTAINVQQQFHFDRILFLPCKVPVLKNNAHASTQHRLEMLSLALKEHSVYPFEMDMSEIGRDSPSYMVTTLETLRNTWGANASLSLILGLDIFEQLPLWHQWERLPSLCNLLVIDRPHPYRSSPVLEQLLHQHESQDEQDLLNKTCGVIYRFNAGVFDISSTNIRRSVADNTLNEAALPRSVAEYIRKHRLYCCR